MLFNTLLITLTAGAATVSANCQGYQLGVGNQQDWGNGISHWNVYDNNCNVVDSQTTNQNPCTAGMFGCSPAPVIFDSYTSSQNGNFYECYPDTTGETCNGDLMAVCCNPPASK